MNTTQRGERCGRCGDVKPLTKEGPHKGMLCEDCSDAKRHEAEREREKTHDSE